VKTVMNLRVPKKAGNFLTECLLASQEGFCSMEWVSKWVSEWVSELVS
jgi:hypothetical protein